MHGVMLLFDGYSFGWTKRVFLYLSGNCFGLRTNSGKDGPRWATLTVGVASGGGKTPEKIGMLSHNAWKVFDSQG